MNLVKDVLHLLGNFCLNHFTLNLRVYASFSRMNFKLCSSHCNVMLVFPMFW